MVTIKITLSEMLKDMAEDFAKENQERLIYIVYEVMRRLGYTNYKIKKIGKEN